MDVWLAVSGMLALLGGGAGALTYWRKNFGGGIPSPDLSDTGSNYTPADLGPTTSVISPGVTGVGGIKLTPTIVTKAGGIVVTTNPNGVVDTSAGIVSPIPVGIGRSTVLPATNAPVDTAASGPAAAAAAALLAKTRANLEGIGL